MSQLRFSLVGVVIALTLSLAACGNDRRAPSNEGREGEGEGVEGEGEGGEGEGEGEGTEGEGEGEGGEGEGEGGEGEGEGGEGEGEGGEGEGEGSLDCQGAAPPSARQDGVCAGLVQHCDAGVWREPVDNELSGELAGFEADELSCDGLDNDCDGETDEQVPPPPDACPEVGVCAGAQAVCAGAAGWQCPVESPEFEGVEALCDGLDNDCDGEQDEACDCVVGQERPCGPGAGPCEEGSQACTPSGWGECVGGVPPAAEDCDGVDDDCDGEIDDGLATPAELLCLSAGVCSGATPRCAGALGWTCPYPQTYELQELSCDGLDNDCDGQTDETLTAPAGFSCPSAGVCAASGPVCLGIEGWACESPDQFQAVELDCDGLDNDCDGQTDEGLSPPAELTCPSAGICSGAAPRCVGADGWRCPYPQGYEATERSCDGVDNDCDGELDEGCVPGGLELTPAQIQFPELRVDRQTPAATVRLRNTGDFPVTGLHLVLGGAHPADFVLVAAGAAAPCQEAGLLAGRAQCTVDVVFVPTVVGPREAELRISAPGMPTQVARLLGTGLPPTAAGTLAAGFPLVRSGELGGQSDTEAIRVVVDAEGYLWASGLADNATGDVELMLWKFEPDGTPVPGFPVHSNPSPGANDLGMALAVDGAGDAWVAGATTNALGNRDMALWKFDAEGQPYPGFPIVRDGDAGTNGDDEALAIALDEGRQTVWLVGYSTGPTTSRDLAVWRFDLDGLLIGVPLIQAGAAGGARDDVAFGLAVDGQGNAWATGYSVNVKPDADLALWKFAPDGTPVPGFPKLRDGGQGDDVGNELVIDAQGDVWVTGYQRASGLSYISLFFALWKFDDQGALLPGFPVLRDGDGGQVGGDMGMAMAFDRAGFLWIAGSSGDDLSASHSSKLVLYKYASDGTLQAGYPKLRSGDGGATELTPLGLAIGPDDGVWVSGIGADATHVFGLFWKFD